jgi:hypothetical protein
MGEKLKISSAGIEFENTCDNCKYGGGDKYGNFFEYGQGSICIRCPVFCCFEESMVDPEEYREDWAREWRDFFDGKIMFVSLVL